MWFRVLLIESYLEHKYLFNQLIEAPSVVGTTGQQQCHLWSKDVMFTTSPTITGL